MGHETNTQNATNGTLAVTPSQEVWTPNQEAALQQAGIDNDVTKAELQTFLHYCQRTGLDPFTKQIYLIGRYDKRAGRKVYRAQTAIDGFRVIARRASDTVHVDYGYADPLWCGPDGKWLDVWLAQEPPAAAKFVVIRNGHQFPAVAKFSEYVPTDKHGNPEKMWQRMPAHMLAKVAEALALRAAFPQDLAGIYTDEEMQQADSTVPADAQVVQGSVARELSGEASALLEKAQACTGDFESLRALWPGNSPVLKETTEDGREVGQVLTALIMDAKQAQEAMQAETDFSGETQPSNQYPCGCSVDEVFQAGAHNEGCPERPPQQDSGK